MDCLAENLDDEEAFLRIEKLKPRLVCFVVYGQNVNAGTTNMGGAVNLCSYIKNNNKNYITSFIGSHVQALPRETLEKEKCIDFIFLNEGIYTLLNILKISRIDLDELKKVNGIVYRKKNNIIFNEPEKVVPTERLDKDLPGYAWDLLPKKKNHLIFIDHHYGMRLIKKN